jgi:hypothetical protein
MNELRSCLGKLKLGLDFCCVYAPSSAIGEGDKLFGTDNEGFLESTFQLFSLLISEI